MQEQHYEIVVTDPDVKSLIVSWYTKEGIFIEQIEHGDKKKLIVLNTAEIKQVIAVLSAFITSPEPHLSDCALHNSPTFPLKPCSCR